MANKLFAEEEKKSGSSLQMLLEMWIDFLVYAANRCSRESHAKKLNSGGEFTTVLWLLTEHLTKLLYSDDRRRFFLSVVEITRDE